MRRLTIRVLYMSVGLMVVLGMGCVPEAGEGSPGSGGSGAPLAGAAGQMSSGGDGQAGSVASVAGAGGGGAATITSAGRGGASAGAASGGAGGGNGHAGSSGDGASGSGGSAGSAGSADTGQRCAEIEAEYASSLAEQVTCSSGVGNQCGSRAEAAPGCECHVPIQPKDPFAIEHLLNLQADWFDADCQEPKCPSNCADTQLGSCQSGNCVPM